MPEPVCVATWEENKRSTAAQRQLAEQHCLGHVATQEKTRDLRIPGPPVRIEDHIKEKAPKTRERGWEEHWRYTEGKHDDSAIAHIEQKKETHCNYQHLHDRVQNKKVSSQANEAKRSKGNFFVARHLDEEKHSHSRGLTTYSLLNVSTHL